MTTEIDGLGRTLRVDAPGTLPTINTYDTRGRLTRTGTGARFEAYTYDARGRIATTTDALSRTTEFTYDLADRATSLRRPDGRVVTYSHDRAGNLLSLTPPGRTAHTFAYSSRDVVDRYTPPSGAASAFAADRDNLRTTVTKPGGVGVTFAYDAAARVDRITQPGRATQYNYAANSGQLTSVAPRAPSRSATAMTAACRRAARWPAASPARSPRPTTATCALVTESVNGANTVANEYDDDGLLTRAGAVVADPWRRRRPRDRRRDRLQRDHDHALDARRAGLGGDQARLGADLQRDLRARQRGPDHESQRELATAGRTHTSTPTTPPTACYQVTRDGALQATYSYDANGNRTQVVRAGSCRSPPPTTRRTG